MHTKFSHLDNCLLTQGKRTEFYVVALEGQALSLVQGLSHMQKEEFGVYSS